MKTLKNISLTLIIFLGGISLPAMTTKVIHSTLTADVDILSFKVNNVEGIINNDNGTITVLVPSGTGLSAVAPVITLPANATVSPASGEAQNFTFSANTPIDTGYSMAICTIRTG